MRRGRVSGSGSAPWSRHRTAGETQPGVGRRRPGRGGCGCSSAAVPAHAAGPPRPARC